jgi:V-type H+-transporting ATPase subunit C
MRYWLVSLPLINGRRDRTFETLEERTATDQRLSQNSKFDIPELRVGTLDTLLTLSVVGKIRRTAVDLSGPQVISSLKVENKKFEEYLAHFRWDEAKFPSRRPLKETIDKILEIMQKTEDELKVQNTCLSVSWIVSWLGR